ncbi:MAG: LysR family transcriptional regulator [Clostridia bacterium]|nr:LysR family transcriptional regulator [Clostridia bacterium]
MNIERLNYFLAVAHHGSFTKAAKDCFISQTAISQQIAALEAEFSVQLFTRTRSGVELTEAGRFLLPLAQQTVQAYRAMTSQMQHRYGENVELTVAYTGPVERELLHRAIPSFCQAHPEARISFRRCPMSKLSLALEQGECDIALAVPGEVAVSGCRCVTVLSRPTRIAVSTASPLANRTVLSLEDIRDQPVIILRLDASLAAAEAIRQWLLSLGFAQEQILRADTIEDQLLMVAVNQGISFMPEHVKSEGIRLIPMSGKLLRPHETVAVFRQNTGMTQEFVRCLQQTP